MRNRIIIIFSIVAFYLAWGIWITANCQLGDKRWEWSIPACDEHCDLGSKYPTK